MSYTPYYTNAPMTVEEYFNTEVIARIERAKAKNEKSYVWEVRHMAVSLVDLCDYAQSQGVNLRIRRNCMVVVYL